MSSLDGAAFWHLVVTKVLMVGNEDTKFIKLENTKFIKLDLLLLAPVIAAMLVERPAASVRSRGLGIAARHSAAQEKVLESVLDNKKDIIGKEGATGDRP